MTMCVFYLDCVFVLYHMGEGLDLPCGHDQLEVVTEALLSFGPTSH